MREKAREEKAREEKAKKKKTAELLVARSLLNIFSHTLWSLPPRNKEGSREQEKKGRVERVVIFLSLTLSLLLFFAHQSLSLPATQSDAAACPFLGPPRCCCCRSSSSCTSSSLLLLLCPCS